MKTMYLVQDLYAPVAYELEDNEFKARVGRPNWFLTLEYAMKEHVYRKTGRSVINESLYDTMLGVNYLRSVL